MTTKWVSFPEIKDVPVNHGKGKSVVTGVVRICFNGADTVFIETHGAHHNDDNPALKFRDREWLASAHLTRNDDGTWRLTDPTVTYGISERGVIGYGQHTARTYREAINAALCATVAEHWTEDYARRARYAVAAQELHRAQEERPEAQAKLSAIIDRINAARAVMVETADRSDDA